MIKVEGLSKKFSGQAVLENIDFEIQEGEIVVFLGESGSGKSVLLQHLIGLFKPDKGYIKIGGVDITQLSENDLLDVRKEIGYLFQEGALYDFMSVYENVSFPLREHTKLRANEIKEKVDRILRLVGLQKAGEKRPSELSGGMRKRAALARSVILGSKILFCDEPTSGLDPIRSRAISDLICDISRKLKCTTLITSHDIRNSFRIADRLFLIREGKIIAKGTPDQMQSSGHNFVKEFLS